MQDLHFHTPKGAKNWLSRIRNRGQVHPPRPRFFQGKLGAYLLSTEGALFGVLAALPLLFLYEGLVWYAADEEGTIRNGADVWLRTFIETLGVAPRHAFLVMLLALLALLPFLYTRPHPPLKPGYYPIMLVEALFYSLFLGLAINLMLYGLSSAFHMTLGGVFAPHGSGGSVPMALGAATASNLGQSIGAGLFEEFMFRVLLLNALLYAGRFVFAPWAAAVVAVLGAAVIFALAHYWGDMGEDFAWDTFWFRTFAGVLFTWLYYLRGFAVTAYAHAMYDIRVMW